MSDRYRVQRLTLRAAQRGEVARAAHLVEDALRTVSVPPLRPGEIWVVRRLDLGAIGLGMPPQALALRMTETLRHVRARALRYDHPSAASVDAVWLPERGEARAALIARLLRGGAAREWFWRGAVPDWNPSWAHAHAVAQLLAPPARTATDDPPPRVIAARTLAWLAQRQLAAPALSYLPPAIAQSLIGAGGASSAPAGASVAPALAGLPAPWPALLRWVARELPRDDPRGVWAACCAIVALRPDLHASHLLAHSARQLALQARGAAARPSTFVRHEPDPGAARARAGHALAPGAREPVAAIRERPAQLAARAAPAAEAKAARQLEPAPARAREPEPSADRSRRDASSSIAPQHGRLCVPPLEAPARTELAGLFFLLPVLARLGLPLTMASEPALLRQAFALCILGGQLDRLQAAPLEPMRRALAPSSEPDPLEPGPFTAPLSWWRGLCDERALDWRRAPGGLHLLAAGDPGLWLAATAVDPRTALGALLDGRSLEPGPDVGAETWLHARRDGWIAACARYSRRVVRLELEAIVRRAGIVAASPTHMDVVLPLRALDLAVRRHALDVNLGWVPYLGRVITIHYVENDDYAALEREAS